MPIYDYQCPKCEIEFEELVFNREAEVDCPKCGIPVSRLPSLVSFKSKGSDGQPTKSQAGSSCAGCTASTCSNCR